MSCETEKSETFERIVAFSPAFDKRNADPMKNYGIHGVEIRFVLKGTRGAMQFMLYTDWQLPHVQRELWGRDGYKRIQPMGTDIGYHSPTPAYEGQARMGPCQYLDGKPCYYDGSSLQAEEFVPEFLAGGSDAVWKMLEDRYAETFNGEPREVPS